MELPASLHPKDALAGLIVGALVTILLVLGGLVFHRSPFRGVPGRHVGYDRAAWAVADVVGAAGAAAMALVITVGQGLIRDVDAGATLAAITAAGIGGAGWSRLCRAVSLRWTVVLVMITASGVWAAVPDTEAAVTVIAAWLPFAVLGVVYGRGQTPPPTRIWIAWCALALAPAWAVAWGASARPEAVPGALACFGVAVVVPWILRVPSRAVDPRWLVAIHVVVVIAAARWAARAPTVREGIVRGAIVVLAVAVVMAASSAVSARRAGPGPRRPSDPAEHPR